MTILDALRWRIGEDAVAYSAALASGDDRAAALLASRIAHSRQLLDDIETDADLADAADTALGRRARERSAWPTTSHPSTPPRPTFAGAPLTIISPRKDLVRR